MMMDGNGRGRDMRSALRGSREQLWRDIMHMWCTYMWLMDRVERSREGFNLAQGPIFSLIFKCESCMRVDVVEHECTLSFEIPLFSRSLAHSVPQ